MSGSGSSNQNSVKLRQPTPTFGSSNSPHAPNVEWLEQSAETISNRSLRSQRSQTRRQSSQRSSLRSRSQYDSATYPYNAGSEYHAGQSWYPQGQYGGPMTQNFEYEGYDNFEHRPTQMQHEFSYMYQSHGTYYNPSGQEQWRSPSSSWQNTVEPRHMLPGQQNQSSVSRGPSITTTSTALREGSLFRDFDGTHYVSVPSGAGESTIVDEEEPQENKEAAASRPSYDDSMVQQLRQVYDEAAREADVDTQQEQDTAEGKAATERIDIMPSQAQNLQGVAPPPDENMVYYPAPVPMKLNRPERISKMPRPDVSVQRRAEVLSSVPHQARKSAAWLHDFGDQGVVPEGDNNSVADTQARAKQLQNIRKLPPQLRATVFFDQQSVPHSVQIKDGSAVATLDSLLDASAKAPPNASIEDTVKAAAADAKHKRNVSGSSSSVLGGIDGAWRSRLSLLPFKKASTEKLSQIQEGRGGSATDRGAYSPAALDERDEEEDDEDDDEEGIYENEETRLAERKTGSYDGKEEDDEGYDLGEESDFGQEENKPEDEEQDHIVAPTTLLAELQLRKHQLRSRNRTAATAFPNGMHSTLLELDAVAQIEKKKRKGQRTALAWEDPGDVAMAKDETQDEDVPLALLFPNKNGLANNAGKDSQVGLLAKRDMEESEPLSKRRNRLKGINPDTPKASKPNIVVAGDDESEHEGETLAQRTRRLKSAKALNDAIGGAAGDQADEGFTNDIMSRFGRVDQAAKSTDQDANIKPRGSPGEEETLGQRRRRLQAEAKGEQNGLSAENPAIRQASNELVSGLVGQNEQQRLQRRDQLSQQTYLSSSNQLQAPLINANGFSAGQRRVSGLLEANAQKLESRRQLIQDTNQRSATVGIDAPLVEQQPYVMQKNHMSMAPLGSGPQLTRQPNNFMSGTYNNGPSFMAPSQLSGFPHLQAQTSVQTRGFASGGFGISPQGLNSTVSGPFVPPDAALLGQAARQVQDGGEGSLSSKQRENIDRWRQSVMQ